MEPNHHALSHQEARRLVSAGNEETLATLRQLDPFRRARELITFPALFAGSGGLIWWAHLHLSGGVGWAVMALATVLSALALNAFVLLLHEGMHGILLPGQRWNRWVSVGLGMMVFISFSAYQSLHNRHHRFLGEARDPDHYDNYAEGARRVWLMQVVRLFFGSLLYIVCIPFLSLKSGTRQERRRILTEYGILAGCYTVIFSLVPFEVLQNIWLVPILFTSLLINLRGLTQHGETDPHDPFTASRSVDPRNPLVSWFLLNENLHLEHHLFPEIPSHHLPAVSRMLEEKAPRQVRSRSYFGFLAAFFGRGFRREREPIGLRESSVAGKAGFREG